MSSVLHDWRTPGHHYRLCRGPVKVAGWKALTPFEAQWVLRAELADSQARQLLFSALRSYSQWQLSVNLTDPGVLEREVELRRLIVFDRPIAPLVLTHSPAPPPPEAPPPRTEPRRELAWIDITVVDDSVPAKPLARTRFRLSLPDGSVREGVLNGQAHLHVDEIAPGKCWLELSDLGRDLEA